MLQNLVVVCQNNTNVFPTNISTLIGHQTSHLWLLFCENHSKNIASRHLFIIILYDLLFIIFIEKITFFRTLTHLKKLNNWIFISIIFGILWYLKKEGWTFFIKFDQRKYKYVVHIIKLKFFHRMIEISPELDNLNQTHDFFFDTLDRSWINYQ